MIFIQKKHDFLCMILDTRLLFTSGFCPIVTSKIVFYSYPIDNYLLGENQNNHDIQYPIRD